MAEGGRGSREPRVAIVQAVQSPLGFFVLVVLVVEVILGVAAALSAGTDRTLLFVAMIALIFLLVVIVTILAVRWPTALNPQSGTTRAPNRQGNGLNLRVALEFEGEQEQADIQLDRRATYIIENAFKPVPSQVKEVLLYEGPGGTGWLCPIPLEAGPNDMITFTFIAINGRQWELTVVPNMLWPKARARRLV